METFQPPKLQFSPTDLSSIPSDTLSSQPAPAPPPSQPPPQPTIASSSSGLPVAPGDGGNSALREHPIYRLSFWQTFFDVDTTLVLRRLLYSIFPFSRRFWKPTHHSPILSVSYDPSQLATSEHPTGLPRRRGDLYGPFWVVTTLIFVLGMSGNAASWLAFAPTPDNPHWRYSFDAISVATATLYPFLILVSAALWLAARFLRKGDAFASSSLPVSDAGVASTNPFGPGPAPAQVPGASAPTAASVPSVSTIPLADLVCVVGYSLAVLIPLSVFSVLPSAALRWTLLAIAFCISATATIVNLFGPLVEAGLTWFRALVVLAVDLLFLALLCVGFELYFF